MSAIASAMSDPGGRPMTRARWAYLSPTLAALNRSTAGSSTAFSVPWWSLRSCNAPSGCDSACTAPRPFWNAIAPSIAAIIMFQRASRSVPVCVARSMLAHARVRPSSAIASAGGFTSGDR